MTTIISGTIKMLEGTELPDWPFEWRDRRNQIIDFSTGWTFTVKIGLPNEAALVTLSSGIAGSASSPNIVVSPGAGSLDALVGGNTYQVDVIARRTSDNRDLGRSYSLVVGNGVGV